MEYVPIYCRDDRMAVILQPQDSMKLYDYSTKLYDDMESGKLTKAQVKWVRSLQSKRVRDELGLFIAEGEKCVNDLCGTFPLVLLVTPENATATEIEQMSSLRTPQGVIGVFRKERIVANMSYPSGVVQDLRSESASSEKHSEEYIGAEELVVALDGVQDPGNLGTILRTCDWFGVHDVYCSKDTVDCFNPKVVQATMGALARVRVHYLDLVCMLQEQREKGVPIYGTLLDGRNMYEDGAIGDATKGVVVMGNEGNGISGEVRTLITHPLYIPSFPKGAATSESLNVGVATAVVLAELRRSILS